MKRLSNILTAICIALLIWSVASYVEVLAKNTQSNPQYSKSNLWIMLVEEMS